MQVGVAPQEPVPQPHPSPTPHPNQRCNKSYPSCVANCVNDFRFDNVVRYAGQSAGYSGVGDFAGENAEAGGNRFPGGTSLLILLGQAVRLTVRE